jgi:hypothetical protein
VEAQFQRSVNFKWYIHNLINTMFTFGTVKQTSLFPPAHGVIFSQLVVREFGLFCHRSSLKAKRPIAQILITFRIIDPVSNACALKNSGKCL